MYLHHVTEDSTLLVCKKDTENLSVPETQPECQVHTQSPDPDNGINPLILYSGSGLLNDDGSIPLGDRGSGSSAC